VFFMIAHPCGILESGFPLLRAEYEISYAIKNDIDVKISNSSKTVTNKRSRRDSQSDWP
jgi:hypothetical protein